MNKLNKVINYIERNLDGEISFRYLARLAGVNQDTLSRIFIFLTRISIYEYIRKRRLSKAYEDLRNTKLRIIDISPSDIATTLQPLFRVLSKKSSVLLRFRLVRVVDASQFFPNYYFKATSIQIAA